MSLTNEAAPGEKPFVRAEVGNTFLRHALIIWAREQGVAEANLTAITRDVLDFAQATVRDSGPRAFLRA